MCVKGEKGIYTYLYVLACIYMYIHMYIHVPEDFDATMVTSGPARSLKPMALGGALSEDGGRREGKRVCRETAGLLVSRVTCNRGPLNCVNGDYNRAYLVEGSFYWCGWLTK